LTQPEKKMPIKRDYTYCIDSAGAIQEDFGNGS
jgi:hypothetical protein